MQEEYLKCKARVSLKVKRREKDIPLVKQIKRNLV